ncbi:hypothetical protein OLS39_09205 [Campylobacter jejuni]|nr:hypothetical protein [Campylobacter jejuni]MCW4448884.1 hypothetical protein [Campylobacter jejuni]
MHSGIRKAFIGGIKCYKSSIISTPLCKELCIEPVAKSFLACMIFCAFLEFNVLCFKGVHFLALESCSFSRFSLLSL